MNLRWNTEEIGYFRFVAKSELPTGRVDVQVGSDRVKIYRQAGTSGGKYGDV